MFRLALLAAVSALVLAPEASAQTPKDTVVMA
jgi:hypothetical protein